MLLLFFAKADENFVIGPAIEVIGDAVDLLPIEDEFLVPQGGDQTFCRALSRIVLAH